MAVLFFFLAWGCGKSDYFLVTHFIFMFVCRSLQEKGRIHIVKSDSVIMEQNE